MSSRRQQKVNNKMEQLRLHPRRNPYTPWLVTGMVLAGLLAGLGYYLHLANRKPIEQLPYDPPVLPTAEILVGETKATVEIADSLPERTQGLMFRKGLAPDHGLLFIFDAPDWLSFWMKNTRIPLDIAFIDEDGSIINILSMTPFDMTSEKYKSERKALYALEMAKGWFEKNGIEPGDTVEIPNSVLAGRGIATPAASPSE